MRPDVPKPSLVETVLKSRCPRCGQGALFRGFLGLEERCETCGLSYEFADSGDGPAVLVIMAAGALVVGLWALTNALVRLNVLMQLVIFVPTIVIVSLGLMRPFKAGLIALQYRHQAREGRSD